MDSVDAAGDRGVPDCGPDAVPIPHGRRLTRMVYCGDRRAFVGAVAPDCASPSLAVVEVVTAATGEDPTDLPPIGDAVDSDALGALVSGR